MRKLALLALLLLLTTAAAQEPTRIVYWSALDGPRAEAQDDLVQRFNESQDDVEVEVQFQGSYDEVLQKYLASLAAGNAPEVVLLCDTCYGALSREGALQPLDPLLDGPNGLDRESFVGAFLSGGQGLDGQLYFMPFATSTPILYYNPDLFEQAGLDGPPQTWDEFFESARTIREETGAYGASLAANNWGWQLQSQIWSQGGEYSNEDFDTFVDSPVWIEEFGRWRDLIHEHDAARIPGSAEGGPFGDFINGRSAMFIASTGLLTSAHEQASGFDPATAMLPEGSAGRVLPTGGSGLAITAGLSDEEQQAAWEFVKFMVTPESNAYFAERTGYMPFRQGAIELLEDTLANEPDRQTAIDQLGNTRNQSQLVAYRGEWRSIIDQAMERILVSGEDPADVFPEAQRQVESALEAEGYR